MLPFANVAQGAFLDGSFGTAQAGDTILAELGGESLGLRVLGRSRFMLQWDVLAAIEAGWLGNEHPFLFLVGPHTLASVELDARILEGKRWSPYVGVGVGGEVSILENPGTSPDQLLTINDVDPIGGVVASGSLRFVAGASLLEPRRSLLLYAVGDELLNAPESNAAGQTFTAIGIGARYDVTRGVLATLEGLVGVSPNGYAPALGLHDRTTRWEASGSFRKLFANGMWIGITASVAEDTDHLAYDVGRTYDTSSAPAFRATLVLGVPLWKAREMRPVVSFALALGACDPQASGWGLDAIDSMKTPDDPAPACGAIASYPSAPLGQCMYGAGSRASETLGIVPGQTPIRHVIVLMKENRSFDHLFGKLHDQGQPGVEAVPASYSNPDSSGNPVLPMHATTTCIPCDPGHQSASVAECIDGGRMDGFVRNAAQTTTSDGKFVLSYYDDTDLPFYYWLATTFAVSDRHFAPMASGTYANRNFLVFASNGGVVDTGLSFPSPATPSLFQTLMNAGFTWRAYTDGSPLSGSLDWKQGDPGVSPLADMFTALQDGTLPNVAFVDGRDMPDGVNAHEDDDHPPDDPPTADHPPTDLQDGERWVKAIYDAAIASPEWGRLAIIWTYDEAGAFADHVPPPLGCPPLPSPSPWQQMGPRVPLVVISPWAKRNYASHVVRDHTAITRFIEAVFDLPALTARDANSDALMDLFDFSCGRDLSVQTAPAAGTGGCANPTSCD